MKALGVVGSRRRDGNTSALIHRIIESFEKRYSNIVETGTDEEGDLARVINLVDYDYRGCEGCKACEEDFECVIEDEMQNIYPLIWEAEVLILGSPAYFYNITPELKAMIDRCYCWEIFSEKDRSVWMGLNELRENKIAGVVAVSGQEGSEGMGFTVKAMKKPLQALGYNVKVELEARGYYKKGEVKKDEEMMRGAEKTGQKLAEALKLRQKASEKI